MTNTIALRRVAYLSAILLSALALLPASALSQSPAATSSTADAVDAEATSTTATTVQPAVTTAALTNRLSDSYRRVDLPDETVYDDFVVSPGRFDVEVAPGQSTVVELSISNRTGIDRVFEIKTEDAVGSETGEAAVQLLGDQVGPYTLKDYISVPAPEFILEHGKRALVPVTISLPSDAEPGGRYGSILISVASQSVDQDGTTGAAAGAKVISRIGALVFLTTPGEIVREGTLQEFATVNDTKFFTAGPVKFELVHENTGSVHMQPYGEIFVTNILGEQVGYVPLTPWYVMPNSLRSREVAWDREFMIGRYTATAEIRRGYDEIIDTKTYTFWVIPLSFMLYLFLGLFVFFFVIRFFARNFEFKRKS